MQNSIAKLLDGVVVEWKPLGKLLIRTKGTKITASQMKELHKDDAPLKIFAGGKTFALVNFDDISEKDINREPSIIVKSRGIIEFEYYDKPFSHKNEMWSYHSKDKQINIKYVYYFLKTKELHFQNIGSKMQMPQIATPDTDKFEIPIPSLHVQTEIVRILDTFTALTAELTAELTARRKQYNYYRDQLLSFQEDEVEWKALGEILHRTKGAKITASKMKEIHKNNAPLKIFAGGKTFALVNFDDIPEKDINREPSIIVKSRGIIEFEYYDKPFSHKNEMWSYHSKDGNINIKYVYYFLKTKELHFQNIGSKMQMPQIATPDTDKFVIPIPSLSIQNRIVEILDKFDALTNSITEGLPREIALRQKQYEYYRNLLLDFPKE
ncbi:restriction endonuclease subunit S [Gilliamella sp. Lep-s21]|nr:restriction endonuclease subunit S [Gilliamella sp. Lep-s35]MWP68519.1 restriction endonuclease subunit S [Gilliamella sp. Lep-s5]MWP77946.1 restriction endonuclease subunit S [Gilliamella sp. Lep-s21]